MIIHKIAVTKIRIDELGDLITTTGTTGMPKIAAHSGANLSFLGKIGAEKSRMSSKTIGLRDLVDDFLFSTARPMAGVFKNVRFSPLRINN